MEKIASEVEIDFIVKPGPGGKFWPMMVITKGGAAVESLLHMNGFKHKADAEKVIEKTKEILTFFVDENEGSDV